MMRFICTEEWYCFFAIEFFVIDDEIGPFIGTLVMECVLKRIFVKKVL